MINFLIKSFKIQTRTQYGMLAGIIGIAANFLLFILKLIIGITSSSVSVTTDSFNNLSDVASATVTLIGFKLAGKPADKSHPFGYGRFEYIATLIISIIIILLGYNFLKDSVMNILNPQMISANVISLCILVMTVVIKLWLSKFNYRIGKVISSGTLTATAVDALNDVIITSTTIASIAFTFFTDIVIDGYVGVIVSCILIYSGVIIMRETVSLLLGQTSDLSNDIQKILSNYAEIIDFHDLVLHSYGHDNVFASVHVEMHDDLSMNSCHDIIDSIERDAHKKLNVSLVIHIDPVNEKIVMLKSIINSCLPNGCSAHEFVLKNETLSFDLITTSSNDNAKLKLKIENEIQSFNPNITCHIKFEIEDK